MCTLIDGSLMEEQTFDPQCHRMQGFIQGLQSSSKGCIHFHVVWVEIRFPCVKEPPTSVSECLLTSHQRKKRILGTENKRPIDRRSGGYSIGENGQIRDSFGMIHFCR